VAGALGCIWMSFLGEFLRLTNGDILVYEDAENCQIESSELHEILTGGAQGGFILRGVSRISSPVPRFWVKCGHVLTFFFKPEIAMNRKLSIIITNRCPTKNGTK
jgi:hypothetical protein